MAQFVTTLDEIKERMQQGWTPSRLMKSASFCRASSARLTSKNAGDFVRNFVVRVKLNQTILQKE